MRQKISNNIVELNSIINQLDIIVIYRILHLTTAKCMFISISQGVFTKIGTYWAIKHINKFIRTEIMQNFLDNNRIKVETNNGKIAGKSQNKE